MIHLVSLKLYIWSKTQMRQFSQLEPSDFVGKSNMLHFAANPEIAILIKDNDWALVVTGSISSITHTYLALKINNSLVFSEDELFLFPLNTLFYVNLTESRWLYQKILRQNEINPAMCEDRIGKFLKERTNERFTYEIEKAKEDVEPCYTFTKSFELWGTPPPRPLLDSVG